jgi:hypothetical protein
MIKVSAPARPVSGKTNRNAIALFMVPPFPLPSFFLLPVSYLEFYLLQCGLIAPHIATNFVASMRLEKTKG